MCRSFVNVHLTGIVKVVVTSLAGAMSAPISFIRKCIFAVPGTHECC
jgi:hypothetical protein